MLISTKGRYALRVMIDLAEHQTDGYIPLKEVAQRQDISEKYLETIIRLLVKANILSGLRGKGGGYKLTKSPDQYTVGAILRLTEDSLAPVSCLGPGAAVCARAAECRTLHMWQGLDSAVQDQKFVLRYLNSHSVFLPRAICRSHASNNMCIHGCGPSGASRTSR